LTARHTFHGGHLVRATGGDMGMKGGTEADVLASCLAYLKLRQIPAWRCNTTGVYDPVRKAFRSFRGLRGVSDILGVLPRTLYVDGRRVTVGLFLACEVKRPGGKLTAEQTVFLDAVRAAGGIALCVSSLRELEIALAELGHGT
jgi:hypothetical protein